MANKRFWLGMLVMTLVFGMTVTGCEEDEAYTYIFINQSSHRVMVRYDYHSQPDSSYTSQKTLYVQSGQTTADTIYDITLHIYYSPSDEVLVTYDIDKRTFTFTDRP
jgi:hypothetical protein